jgi:hypothetical protein
MARRGFTPADLAQVMNLYNGALLVGFWGTRPLQDGTVSGHSVAAIVGSVFVEFMDPNLGYLRVRKDQFWDMFIDHLNINYSHLRGKWVIERISRSH